MLELSVPVRNWTTVAVRTEPAGCRHEGRRRPIARRNQDAAVSGQTLGCHVDTWIDSVREVSSFLAEWHWKVRPDERGEMHLP